MADRRQLLGKQGEAAAYAFLERQGYSILATNYRCPWGEVDIVASQDETLAFVEVRTRRGGALGTPEESVTRTKRRRLIATAQHYLQEHGDAPHWRIDLVAVEVDKRGAIRRIRRIRLLQNAVTEEDQEEVS